MTARILVLPVLGLVFLVLAGCEHIGRTVDEAAKEIAETIERSTSGQPTDGASQNRSQTRVSTYDKELVRDVQRKLNSSGYHAGPADGLWGDRSRTALTHYQRDKGLQQSGEFDAKTLTALGIDPKKLSAPTSKSEQLPEKGPAQNDTRISQPTKPQSPSSPEKSSDDAISSPEPENVEVVQPNPANKEHGVPTDTDDLFAPEEPSPGTTTHEDNVDQDKEKEPAKMLLISREVELYDDSDPFSKVLVRVPAGTQLDILFESAEWFGVQYKNHTGFIEKNAVQ